MKKIGKHRLYLGDCLKVLQKLEDNSIDSIVTDPPYGLGFMGKAWDHGVPATKIWKECLRVLKPGGYLLAFAGTRTQHRMAVNIEDAGFEIRDMIAWSYGSGFPKSQDVGKAIDKAKGVKRKVVGVNPSSRPNSKKVGGAGFDSNVGSKVGAGVQYLTEPSTQEAKDWDGWGVALKPALEPITVARKPLEGTVVNNVLKYGTGAMNIDGCRVGSFVNTTPSGANRRNAKLQELGYRPGNYEQESKTPDLKSGRYPANFIHDGSDEVIRLFPYSKDGVAVGRNKRQGEASGNKVYGKRNVDTKDVSYGGSGSAARFFKECSHDGETDWLQNILPKSANTARKGLSLPELADAFVQSIAPRLERLEDKVLSVVKAHSIRVTEKESKKLLMIAMRTIQSLGLRCLPDLQPEKLTQSNNDVKTVIAEKQTGTTTITVSLSKSDGSVASVTFSITQSKKAHGDQGYVNRLYYCAKANKKDREDGNNHPTVKPTDLMRYLVRLVTRRGGIVCDPFMGSGTTGKACVAEGMVFYGIEKEKPYFRISVKRVRSARERKRANKESTNTKSGGAF